MLSVIPSEIQKDSGMNVHSLAMKLDCLVSR